MSLTSEKNAEIVSKLAKHHDRFVLTGSLARGVLLGKDITDLADPRGNRFQDVDIINRTTILTDEYDFMGGHLGAGVTKVVRPVLDSKDTWGFYDNRDPVNPATMPISTFTEASLELTDQLFSRFYPNDAITVPSPRAMLYLSNFFAYAQQMPKHHKQIAELHKIAGPVVPELDDAYNEFIKKMLERYPLTTYTRARKIFFDHAPRLAFAAQQSLLGPTIRRIRGVDESNLIPLTNIEEVSSQ